MPPCRVALDRAGIVRNTLAEGGESLRERPPATGERLRPDAPLSLAHEFVRLTGGGILGIACAPAPLSWSPA